MCFPIHMVFLYLVWIFVLTLHMWSWQIWWFNNIQWHPDLSSPNLNLFIPFLPCKCPFRLLLGTSSTYYPCLFPFLSEIGALLLLTSIFPCTCHKKFRSYISSLLDCHLPPVCCVFCLLVWYWWSDESLRVLIPQESTILPQQMPVISLFAHLNAIL